MHIKRRKLLGSMVVATSFAFAMTPAYAEKTMNIGFGAPAKSLYGLIASKVKKHVEAETGGAVKVKLRHSGQIATEDQGFKAMQLGTADGFVMTLSNVAPHWEIASVFDLPYIFKSPEHAIKIMNGSIGDELRAKLQKDTSVHLPTFGLAIYRDFFNSVRPINSMADMKGIKIRVPKNKVMIATFEAFGANPVPLPWSETPTALQTGTVQGGDNATAFIRSLKFYEHQNNLAILNHLVGFAPVFVSDHFMKKLSDAERKQVVKGVAKGVNEAGAIISKGVTTHRKWLSTEGGMKMTTPDVSEFVKVAKKVQEDIAKSKGADYNMYLKKVMNAQ